MIAGAGGPGGSVNGGNGTHGSPSKFGHIIAAGGKAGVGGTSAGTPVLKSGGAGGARQSYPTTAGLTIGSNFFEHVLVPGGNGGDIQTGAAVNPASVETRTWGTTGGGGGGGALSNNTVPAAALGSNGGGVLVTKPDVGNNSNTISSWAAVISAEILSPNGNNSFNASTISGVMYSAPATSTNNTASGEYFYSGSAVKIGLGGAGGKYRGQADVDGEKGGKGGLYGGGGGGGGAALQNTAGNARGGGGGNGGNGCVLVITT